jgi:hypothetical protein
MIITQIVGGLGNQMFQYAHGRALSLRNKTVLKLDVDYYSQYDLRKFSLNVYPIHASIATKEEIAQLKQIRKKPSIPLVSRFLPDPQTWFEEKNMRFDAKYLVLPSNVYVQGYWQCEKYFADFENEIRKDFTVLSAPKDGNAVMMEKINSCHAISIHIRRGDYVTNAHTNQVHGTCSLEYYREAVNMLAEGHHNPQVFVFSDDLQWVAQNLQLTIPMVMVDCNNADTDFEDIRLMSACKDHVIANSSFSWWGAWLNPNKSKRVIAPKRWFAAENMNAQSVDVVPQSWIRL